MRKFIVSIVAMTLLCLFYTSQQVKLLEYSYQINNNYKTVRLLIDEHEGLRYNVASLKSPGNLRRRLAKNNIDLYTSKNWHHIRLAKLTQKDTVKKLSREGSFSIAARAVMNIFTPKALAIAQELDQP